MSLLGFWIFDLTGIAPIKSRDMQIIAPEHGNDNTAMIPAYVKNAKMRAWVQERATLCQPDRIYLV